MAGRRPDAVTGLVVFNTNSFTGWRWHRFARHLRTPVLGNLMMAPVPKWVLRRFLAGGFAGEPPDWFVDQVWEGWKRRSTRRAILRLYRNTVDTDYGYAEEVLPALAGTPALVVWGDRDRFVSRRFADRYRQALGGEVVHLDAGHFPMVERPDEVVAAVRPFLAGRVG